MFSGFQIGKKDVKGENLYCGALVLFKTPMYPLRSIKGKIKYDNNCCIFYIEPTERTNIKYKFSDCIESIELIR